MPKLWPARSMTASRGAVRRLLPGLLGLLGAVGLQAGALEAKVGSEQFHREIEPMLKEFCHDCHGDGMDKGGVKLDAFVSDGALLESRELWLHVLKNVRAGLMPPPKKKQPTAEQKQTLEAWIKSAVFQVDPENPDPGRVTVRRLNRVEYRNTIRDLLGVDFDTQSEFPADDSGHGFDNIGDALTLSPLLLEKYLAAARTIVGKAVPTVSAVPAEHVIVGKEFRGDPNANASSTNKPAQSGTTLTLSYYDPARVTNVFKAEHAGQYEVVVFFTANERYVDNQFDYNKCRFTFRLDGEPLLQKEYAREGGRQFRLDYDRALKAGDHELVVELEPLTPAVRRVRSLTMRVESVSVNGPLDKKFWVKPKGYEKFFTRETPRGTAARRKYARELLAPFVQKAYRRPVDDQTLERLVAVAEGTFTQKGKTFEEGVSQAMIAVLASPRFLFREEAAETPAPSGHPWVDEYSLASRLSYFLWSSMPDAELLRLAGERKLRAGLDAQVKRMLADKKSEAFVRNFVGQWLQTRDIETVTIDARQVLNREETNVPPSMAAAPTVDAEREKRLARFRELRAKEETDEKAMTAAEKKELQEVHDGLFGPGTPRVASTQVTQTTPTNQPPRQFRGFRPLRAELNGDLRRAMRLETEKSFDYVLREDRSLLELLNSDYTFLNERLAKHYGLTNLNVTGEEMVRVKLPADSPRGGVITQGSVLAVTSNPTRTSPVKRGLFVLDNLLGTPPPPPPPDIPPLEDAAKAMKDKKLSLRETLALHREQPLCSSCHNRMDPLGLALDNFNAMGMWRDQERGQPIDATGTLLSGESFTNIIELKRILAANHATEFYRTIAEKLLTYALGRGLEYHDVAAVDAIVERLEKSNGRPSELLAGIISSAPFQKTRAFNPTPKVKSNEPVGQRADARTKP